MKIELTENQAVFLSNFLKSHNDAGTQREEWASDELLNLRTLVHDTVNKAEGLKKGNDFCPECFDDMSHGNFCSNCGRALNNIIKK